jgi:hypothetical protein
VSAPTDAELEDRLRRTYRAVADRTVVVDGRPATEARGTVMRLAPPPRRRGLRVAAALLVATGAAAAVAGLGLTGHPGDRAATRTDAGRWERLPDPPIPVANNGVVWTGKEAIVFSDGPRADMAAAYDPATRTWRRLPDLPTPAVGVGIRGVWTGREVVAFPIQEKVTHAAVYDPATGAWRVLPGTYPTVWLRTTLAWTGDRVLLADVGPEEDVLSFPPRALHAGLLDPATGVWQALPDSPKVVRGATQSVWTGARLLVAGQGNGPVPMLALDLRTRAWRDVPPAPIGTRTDPVVVWTGTVVVIAGGEIGRDPTPSRAAAALDPATLTWHDVPPPPVAVGNPLGSVVHVGGSVYGHATGAHRPLLFDTATRTWAFAAPPPPALADRRTAQSAYGMGDEVLVLSDDGLPLFAYHPPGG